MTAKIVNNEIITHCWKILYPFGQHCWVITSLLKCMFFSCFSVMMTVKHEKNLFSSMALVNFIDAMSKISLYGKYKFRQFDNTLAVRIGYSCWSSSENSILRLTWPSVGIHTLKISWWQLLFKKTWFKWRKCARCGRDTIALVLRSFSKCI